MPNNHEVFLNTSQLIWGNASQAKPIDSKLGFRFGVYKFFCSFEKSFGSYFKLTNIKQCGAWLTHIGGGSI